MALEFELYPEANGKLGTESKWHSYRKERRQTPSLPDTVEEWSDKQRKGKAVYCTAKLS